MMKDKYKEKKRPLKFSTNHSGEHDSNDTIS